MRELALATKPGPWAELTHRYGPFYGIFRKGRLAAMAGGDGVAEVSGVCTWPEFQGQGMGARLTRHVMATLRQRGDRPISIPMPTIPPRLGFTASSVSANSGK